MAVNTIDNVVELSRRDMFGVSFEDAVNETSELNKLSISVGSLKPKISDQEFGKFHYCLIFISGIFMTSVFWETMGVSYALPVAECDLNITSKQQYGIVSGVWYGGMYAMTSSVESVDLSTISCRRNYRVIECVGIHKRHIWTTKCADNCHINGSLDLSTVQSGGESVAIGSVPTPQRHFVRNAIHMLTISRNLFTTPIKQYFRHQYDLRLPWRISQCSKSVAIDHDIVGDFRSILSLPAYGGNVDHQPAMEFLHSNRSGDL